MNILPFVIALLGIMIGLSQAIFHQNTTLRIQQRAYSSYMKAERQARIDGSHKLWDRYKTKNVQSTPSERDIQPKKNYRQQDCYWEHSRLNIFSLLHTDAPHTHLRKTLERLLDELYGPMKEYCTLKEQGRLKLFMNQWLASKAKTLGDIRFDDPDFTRLFYKMTRGCVYYDVNKHEGFPPLDAYVCLQEELHSKPMPWRTARPALLRAFFGDLAEKILQKEADLQAVDPGRISTLTLEEFNELISAQLSESANNLSELLDHRCRKQASFSFGENDQKHPWTRVIRKH